MGITVVLFGQSRLPSIRDDSPLSSQRASRQTISLHRSNSSDARLYISLHMSYPNRRTRAQTDRYPNHHRNNYRKSDIIHHKFPRTPSRWSRLGSTRRTTRFRYTYRQICNLELLLLVSSLNDWCRRLHVFGCFGRGLVRSVLAPQYWVEDKGLTLFLRPLG